MDLTGALLARQVQARVAAIWLSIGLPQN